MKLIYNMIFMKLIYNMTFMKLICNMTFMKLIYNMIFMKLIYNMTFYTIKFDDDTSYDIIFHDMAFWDKITTYSVQIMVTH